MTIVYCDVGEPDKRAVCAWGCVVIHNGSEYIFSGYSLDKKALQHSKFYALIKSFHVLSQFDAKDVKIYIEEPTIIYNFNEMNRGKQLKFQEGYAYYFKLLCNYALKYNLTLHEIHPTQNRAHHIANYTYRNAVKSLEANRTANHASKQQKPQKSPSAIVKSCIPRDIKNHKDFNTHIANILNQCSKQAGFHSLLSNQGVCMSGFYQLLKNRFPKKILYKQNGEKKLHMSFARALQGSKFCV